ncbi:hypothetical protein [Gloeomargarita lithophora]|uniref:hypothetical protein n=1 Tax=Gloeomargarita lithophora TaxID=1188228 RepID=UPI0008F8F7AB|nr:hypothetical protein [Gloeomargarita lithophora]
MGRPKQIYIDLDKANKLKRRLEVLAKKPPPPPQITVDKFIEENLETLERATTAGVTWILLATELSEITGESITQERLKKVYSRIKNKVREIAPNP